MVSRGCPGGGQGGGGTTYVQAKTANEVLKAQRARLELQRAKGELVERQKAQAMVFRLARQERDAWQTWPARVAALMAADLGVDAATVQQVLDQYVRSHLSDLADLRVDLDGSGGGGGEDEEDLDLLRFDEADAQIDEEKIKATYEFFSYIDETFSFEFLERIALECPC